MLLEACLVGAYLRVAYWEEGHLDQEETHPGQDLLVMEVYAKQNHRHLDSR